MSSVADPLVSIIVPCFNGGRFLTALLAALAEQTFRNFETIIVDDGSSDPETIRFLAELPADVRVIRQENKGLPAARNAGFNAARARLVLPLDCDDAIAPDFLQLAVRMLDGRQSSRYFVFSDMRAHGAREAILTRRFNPFDQLFLNQLPYALLMPKAAWEEIGGYDEAMRDGYEDWEFNLRLLKAGYRGLRLASPMFLYFVSPSGMQLGHSALRHGRIWRYIRTKHRDLYSFRTVRRMWSMEGVDPGRVTWWMAAALYSAGIILPDRAFGRLFRHFLMMRTRVS